MRNFLQQAFFPSGFTHLQVSEMTGVFLLSVFWKVEKQMVRMCLPGLGSASGGISSIPGSALRTPLGHIQGFVF